MGDFGYELSSELDVGLVELCAEYEEKIDRGIPIEIRVHHLKDFYYSIRLNHWANLDYFPDCNEKFVRKIMRKLDNNPNSKVKVIADYDFMCPFCLKKVREECCNLMQIDGDLEDLQKFGCMMELTTYTTSKLLAILSKYYARLEKAK